MGDSGQTLKKTPLANEHVKLGARMVDFGGWNMPVQYTNVIDEHNTTRTKAGIFDISHMGEFIISGKNTKEFLQKICLNDINKLVIGKAQYSMFCNENGGVIDDIFIYQLEENKFMIVTNAGTIDKDFQWMLKHKLEGVEIENISDETAKIDIQGPLSQEILQKICDSDLNELKRFHYVDTKIDNVNCKISRTGYTGEDGFELYFDSEKSVQIWNKLLAVGKPLGMKPVGLGARDTLRLEACYSLYGHELNDNTTPVEASLSWLVREKDFIGSDVILKQKKQGPDRINVAFEMLDKAIPREHYPIFKNNIEIGEVSSGSFSPTFKKGLGLGFVMFNYKEPGTEIDILIRNKLYKAKIVKKPIYGYKGGK